uniref:Uncharacterized protein n=1 Tax=Knipowitschia caucasica TaxID=637954 RepID=A0AAV2KSU9_KNICA
MLRWSQHKLSHRGGSLMSLPTAGLSANHSESRAHNICMCDYGVSGKRAQCSIVTEEPERHTSPAVRGVEEWNSRRLGPGCESMCLQTDPRRGTISHGQAAAAAATATATRTQPWHTQEQTRRFC